MTFHKITIDERDFPRLIKILRRKGFSDEELEAAIGGIRQFLKRKSMDSGNGGK